MIIDSINYFCHDLSMNAETPPPIDRLGHEGDEFHLVREVLRTHQAIMVGFANTMGHPPARLAVLRVIATAPEAVGVMALARHLGINAAAVTRQVKEMESARLVCRRADPHDARRIRLSLTAKGQAVFEEVHRRIHELERTLADQTSPEDIARAVNVLSTFRRMFERDEAAALSHPSSGGHLQDAASGPNTIGMKT